MLGYISDDARGASDRLLLGLADQLSSQGVKLAGAVQENLEADGLPRCDMVLRILGLSDRIEISQRLGPLATGCRLDPDALERAVGLVESTLPDDISLLIVNKFGKQEADGRGFRHVMAEALAMGIPVITAVRDAYLPDFLEFAGEFATPVAADPASIRSWITQTRERVAAS